MRNRFRRGPSDSRASRSVVATSTFLAYRSASHGDRSAVASPFVPSIFGSTCEAAEAVTWPALCDSKENMAAFLIAVLNLQWAPRRCSLPSAPTP